jgi:hypothetical protein
VGYYTRVDGSMTFSPELSGSEMDELRDWLDMTGYLGYGGDLRASSYSTQFDGKAYGFEDELREFVQRLSAKTTRTVRGEFVGVGEEQPDVWRLRVKDNTVTREEARLVWPDGTEYRG